MKSPLKKYPLYGAFLSLRGVPVLVVGGGSVAARKVATLHSCGADVRVVAREFGSQFKAQNSKFKIIRRAFRFSDLKGCRLVFAATDDEKLNARICALAIKRGIWCNCAAPPEAGNFFVPAIVQRGDFAIAVSTGGASAALAAHWRKRLEKLCGEEWGELAALQAKMRELAKAKIKDAKYRRGILIKLGAAHWARKIKTLGMAAVETAMKKLIDQK